VTLPFAIDTPQLVPDHIRRFARLLISWWSSEARAAGLVDPGVFVSERFSFDDYAVAIDRARRGIGRKILVGPLGPALDPSSTRRAYVSSAGPAT
jgi:hypothetical protein